MRIRVDDTTPVPPFEQIRAQIALHVAAGRLHPGERLPAIRSLANELDVSTNTIARAYRELIRAGIAEASGRRGTRITAAPPIAHQVAFQSEQLEAAADRFALAADELAVPTDEALESIIHAMRRLQQLHQRPGRPKQQDTSAASAASAATAAASRSSLTTPPKTSESCAAETSSPYSNPELRTLVSSSSYPPATQAPLRCNFSGGNVRADGQAFLGDDLLYFVLVDTGRGGRSHPPRLDVG